MQLPGLNPFELMERMCKPDLLRDAIVNYLTANDCPVDSLPKSLGTRVVFHQLAIATGINQFFKGTPSALNSNMVNSFQLPQNEHLIITAIRVLTGNGTTINAIDWSYGAALAVAKNGNFDVQLNGINWLKAMPGSRACEDLTDANLGFINLDVPMAWPAQTDAVINYTILTAPAANDAIRMELHGVGFIS